MDSRPKNGQFFRRIYLRRKTLIWMQIISLIMMVSYAFHKIGNTPSDDESDEYDYRNDYTSHTFSPFVVRDLIHHNNAHPYIYNDDIYGPLSINDPIVVVQVHDRVFYLKYLISSLERVKGIDRALIIFSHDVYRQDINSLVQSIKFCKVMQIFFPFSLQAYPNEFPGQDILDCPRDISKEEALKVKCTNANYSDSYGHYREATYTQTKHHWFWKTSYIFDKLNVSRDHIGSFIFLEEDHFALPDMLHMLNLMMKFTKESCNNCDLLALGAYPKYPNLAIDGQKVEIHEWISSRDNMGMVLNKTVWKRIKACSEQFCKYDDYNWDWSLMFVSRNCMDRPMKALALVTPRVFHIGQCGVHHKSKNCFRNKLVDKVMLISRSFDYLFPSHLQLQKPRPKRFKMPKINGGWGDARDHALCLKQVQE